MNDRPEREFEIARGVRISADPDTLSKSAVIDELYELGNYASSLQIQMRALRSVLQHAIKKG
ncbi:hypothetical protein BSP239C_03606 [Brevibacterium sp. 239c]|uniref:hypothetical protein n=1 Tax=Brevibacterium sp. 239c TaxID=1965356 RepID=UPI000C563057|nr:hypothetical protein [Brevibacterium sp. 239c]SMY03747.1 hypothetical protein BSP239C_03606 [Brevibacterium sp. 239c]